MTDEKRTVRGMTLNVWTDGELASISHPFKWYPDLRDETGKLTHVGGWSIQDYLIESKQDLDHLRTALDALEPLIREFSPDTQQEMYGGEETAK